MPNNVKTTKKPIFFTKQELLAISNNLDVTHIDYAIAERIYSKIVVEYTRLTEEDENE
jgi:hypothetical protein